MLHTDRQSQKSIYVQHTSTETQIYKHKAEWFTSSSSSSILCCDSPTKCFKQRPHSYPSRVLLLLSNHQSNFLRLLCFLCVLLPRKSFFSICCLSKCCSSWIQKWWSVNHQQRSSASFHHPARGLDPSFRVCLSSSPPAGSISLVIERNCACWLWRLSWHWCKRGAVMLLTLLSLPPSFPHTPTMRMHTHKKPHEYTHTRACVHTHAHALSLSLSRVAKCQTAKGVSCFCTVIEGM